MQNVFFMVPTFYEMLFFSFPESFFMFQIDKYIFLSENRILDKKNDTKITYFNTIEKCVQNCGLVVAAKSSSIPSKSIDKLVSFCIRYKKEIVWFEEEKPLNYTEALNKSIEFKSHPVIAILYCGSLSLPSIFELKIRDVFCANKVRIAQFFSLQAKTIIKGFKNHKNTLSFDDILVDYQKKDVIIYSSNIGDNFQFLDQCISNCLETMPDYIFVLTTVDHVNHYSEIAEKIRFCINDQVNFRIITSKYHVLPNDNKVFCEDYLNSEKLLYLDEIDYNGLFEDVISHISIPNGIVAIDV